MQEDMAPLRWGKLGELAKNLIILSGYEFSKYSKQFKRLLTLTLCIRCVVMVVMFGCMLSATKFLANFLRYATHT